MDFVTRIGILGIILALAGVAVTVLWPTKRWIGYLCLVGAFGVLCYWPYLEYMNRHLESANPEPPKVVVEQPKPEPTPAPPPKSLPLKLDFLIGNDGTINVVNDGRGVTGLELYVATCELNHAAFVAHALKVERCSFTGGALKTIPNVPHGARIRIDMAKIAFVKFREIDPKDCHHTDTYTVECQSLPRMDEFWYLVRFLFWDPVGREAREHYDVISDQLHSPVMFGHPEYPGAQWKPGGHWWFNDIPLLLKAEGREYFGTDSREYNEYHADPIKVLKEQAKAATKSKD